MFVDKFNFQCSFLLSGHASGCRLGEIGFLWPSSVLFELYFDKVTSLTYLKACHLYFCTAKYWYKYIYIFFSFNSVFVT